MQINKPVVSVVLDKRRTKSNGKYPVKLRVFNASPRKQKLYSTIFDYTEQEFFSIWEITKPRKENKEKRQQLVALEQKAVTVIDSLKQFSFDAFERELFNKREIDHSDVFCLLDEIESEHTTKGSISTAEKYRSTKSCIKRYLKTKGRISSSLPIEAIDIKFLSDLQGFCENIGHSTATIGINMRNLRTVFNRAISHSSISGDLYPFGKGKYQIPSGKKVNKALTEEQLKLLWDSVPQNDNQALAKDFWFFSFYSYGMNTKDICELKHSSVNEHTFSYVRAKTKNTRKEQSIKEVPITESLRQIMERRKSNDSPYFFGILNENDTPEQKHKKIKGFNRKINRHFRHLAKEVGISEELVSEIGTYFTRHSFATRAVKKGMNIALISEILHDGNIQTTQNYINSFSKEAYKELSKELEL